MTQAQLDLQTQLEHKNTDLTTQHLVNASPVLFLESMDQTNTTFSEQVEHRYISPNNSTPFQHYLPSINLVKRLRYQKRNTKS